MGPLRLSFAPLAQTSSYATVGKHSDIACYFLVIEIFYCANTTAFRMPDWKISESG